MYAMLGSQPDIDFAVNQLIQYGSNPVQSHVNAAMHVLHYLKATHGHQLTHGKNDCSELITYSDSNSAADPDTCHSTTGFSLPLLGLVSPG